MPEDPNLTITLTVGGKQRNLDRPKSEPLEKPLLRIQKSAAAPPDKKQERQVAATAGAAEAGNSLAAEALFVGLHDGPTLAHPLLDPGSTANEDAWRQGRLLRVGTTSYLIEVNPPLVEKVETHGTAFVGIPVVPVPKLLFAEVEDCTWKWWRHQKNTAAAACTGGAAAALEWQEIAGATSQGYTPTEADIGYILRVECTPTRRDTPNSTISIGAAVVTETSSPVVACPVPSSSTGRAELTSTPLNSPSFRIVTYNILADQYASTDAAKTQIFATCPLENLDPLYRRPLVLQELLQYNADVICLQEVDDKMFNLCLQPAMNIAGFDGVFTNKAGKVREGSATFWRKTRFKLLARRDIVLKKLFPATSSEEDIKTAKYGPVFEPMLSSSPALCTALQRVATVGQLSLLAPIDTDTPSSSPSDEASRPLCIANTHLFFHYAAPHIRTMHVWAIIKEACDFAAAAGGGDVALTSAAGGKYPALIFCGDLNSDLNDGIPGAIQLLSQGNLSSTYWDWAFGINFKWQKDEEEQGDDGKDSTGGGGGACGDKTKNNSTPGPEIASNTEQSNGVTGSIHSVISGINEGGEVQKMLHTDVDHLCPSSPRSPAEKVPGIDLELPFALAAADNLRSNVTNYVRGYEGLLDYVWYQPGRLEVERIIPVPPSDQLGGYIPNKRYPSDHLAVVADLRFSSTSNSGGGSGSSRSGVYKSDGKNGSGNCGAGDFGDEVTGPGCVLPAALYNVGVAAYILSTEKYSTAGVIAVPTDTIYGLAACAKEESAVKRIYDIKARAAEKPVAICVADYDDVSRYVETAHLPQGLLEALLPGPLTVLLKKKSGAPIAAALNPGVATLGVRIPDNKFIRAVCRQHRGALALTSANISGQKSSLCVEEFKALWPQCEVVFDGGAIPSSRKGSTIVDLTGLGEYRFVRQGEGLEKVVKLLEGKFKLTRKD